MLTWANLDFLLMWGRLASGSDCFLSVSLGQANLANLFSYFSIHERKFLC